jgi:alkylation response protein AidB-like acyl-CoA dehydrogenase
MNTERERTLARWRTEIRNVVSGLVQGCEEDYPVEAVRRLLALGVQRLSLDPGVGGEGLGMRGLAAVLEDLAAVDGSLAAIVMGMDGANAFWPRMAPRHSGKAR